MSSEAQNPALTEFTTGSSVSCPHCSRSNWLSLERIWTYFEGQHAICEHDDCGRAFDWYEVLVGSTDLVFTAFSAVGARHCQFNIQMRPHQVLKVDFSSHMEEGGRILWVNYTPQGGTGGAIFPVELHGNRPSRRWTSTVRLLGRPIQGTPEDYEATIGIAFAWIPRTEDDPSWESLVDAFEALYEQSYVDAIIPANTAMEVRLGRFLDDFIQVRTGIGRKRRAHFLTNGATYGHQLDVLLPLVTALVDAEPMPNRVRTELRKLKKERNALVHTATPLTQLGKAEAITMCVAAVLGCVYIDYLRVKLLAADPPS